MKAIDLAIELYRELDEPTDINPTLISLWLRENIGLLNNRIAGQFIISPTDSEISPALGEDEKAIFKHLYLIHYYDRKLRATLLAANTDSVIEVTEGGATVRMLNKNELSKTFLALKKEESRNLDMLVHAYMRNRSNPIQVTGTDTIEGIYNPHGLER